MSVAQTYRKTITVIARYQNQKKWQDSGKQYTETKLLSDMNEYYVTIETEGLIRDAIKGTKVDLTFEDTNNPKYKKIIKIHSISENTNPRKPQAKSEQNNGHGLPPLPEPLKDSEIDAMLDSAVERVAAYFNKSKEGVKAEQGLQGITQIVLSAELTRKIQIFEVEMARRKEAVWKKG